MRTHTKKTAGQALKGAGVPALPLDLKPRYCGNPGTQVTGGSSHVLCSFWEVVCAKCENKTITQGELPCFCHKSVSIYGKLFECVKNPDKRPDLPNAIVVRERIVECKPPEVRPSRFVGIENYHTCA